MNTHPLEVIERLIDVELRRRSYTTLDEFKNSFIPILRMKLDGLLWAPIENALFNKDIEWDDKEFRKHARLHQHSLCCLMDTVVKRLEEEEEQNPEQFHPVLQLRDCYKIIFNHLQQYVISMHESFKRHLDLDCLIPSFYFDIDEDNLKANLRLIRDKISDAGIDGEYWAILRQAFNCLFSANGSKISYRQLSYLQELDKGLVELLSENNDVFPERLQFRLMHLNFNDSRYVSFTIELIKKEIDSIPSFIEKRKRLLYLQNDVRLPFPEMGIGYMPAELSLKIQLERWIAERITRLVTEPYTLTLEDLDSETAMFIRQASDMEMSASQLNQYLKLIMEEDFYREKKEEVDYLFSTFCKTVPEDNPAVSKMLSLLKIAVKLKKVKSRLWF